ncbi:D-serine dehydratase [Yarrowia sp. C11]|nr:D-serine dehydratase [Yarrowia sp. E02]KAG5369625.1 D-serine dehydratase [Yarrowia sp. C11]
MTSIDEISVPALLVNRNILKQNADRMLGNVLALSDQFQGKIKFRAHVKTLKCTQVTRLQLGAGDNKWENLTGRIVCSTLEEIRQCRVLVEEGLVTDLIYGVPPGPSKRRELEDLQKQFKHLGARLHLLVDNPDQLWEGRDPELTSFFVKIDADDHRAGTTTGQNEFKCLVSQPGLAGFYAHAGNSYAAKTSAEAEAHLLRELKAVHEASKATPDPQSLILSVGATPTAHISGPSLAKETRELIDAMEGEIEIHAGNFVCLDLQQVSTSLAPVEHIASTVLSEIVSYYPERNEYLISSGVLALAREPAGSKFPGIAHIKGNDEWYVSRVSQEHGILSPLKEAARKCFQIGDKIELYPQHACITSSLFNKYYVVEDNLVVDEWVPWRGW